LVTQWRLRTVVSPQSLMILETFFLVEEKHAMRVQNFHDP
jgi:hypothetical protein